MAASRASHEASDHAESFAVGLLNPDATAPPHIANLRGDPADRRYNIYRNNVTVSLIEALVAIYPATQRLTGADFFRAMARFHVRETPPTSPLLFEYGRDFPAHIERYKYAKQLPWLADVARIERAWLDAYHAADAPTLTAVDLAAVPQERLADLRFRPHPATRIVKSPYPAASIFAINRSADAEANLTSDAAEAALVTRPLLDVSVRTLPSASAAFLEALLDGRTLGEAADAAFETDAAFDLNSNFTDMITAGVFEGLQPPEPTR